MNSKNKVKTIIAVILSVFVLLLGLNVIIFELYISKYYKAEHDAIFASQISTDDVSVSKTKIKGNDALVFSPRNPKAGLIFYPGGKVEYESYAPLMQECASRGILCVLVKMPDNLAILDGNVAKDVIVAFPEISDWYIGGHSLGGVMSARYADKNPDKVKGVIFLGSYSTRDLSMDNLKVLSVYGSEDKVLNMEKYNEAKPNFGSVYKEIVIPGGCHSYFGDYGMQDGDGNPTITRQEQMRITADAIYDIINGN